MSVALLLTLSACTGEIANTTVPGGGNANPAGGMAGAGGNLPITPGKPETGIIPSSPGPSSNLLRLNSLQWENTVRDLFRLPQATGLSENFLAEPYLTTFNNAGGSYEVSEQLRVQYQRAADTLAKSYAHDATKLATIIPAAAPADPEGKARAFISAFGKRAYRRPITDAEVEQYVTLYKAGPTLIASTDPFGDGMELVLTTILQSPNFLYRTEFGTGTATGGKMPLNDYEIASRLSYAIGNTMPDDTLFKAADSGQLHGADTVMAEAKRLFDSPAGQATISDFYNQLMREVDPSTLMRDPTVVPAFLPGMGLEMKQERELFAEEVILHQDGGLRELFTAPYTFVNSHLAPLYGVPAPSGSDWTKVPLNPAERGGLYTQTGFLASTSYDKTTRPIIRGVHINRHVLCAAVPPPPPNVNTMLPTTTGNITNRQLFEQITSPAQCQACHPNMINPLGFAFENYDVLGRYRTMEGTLPIDASASYTFTDGPKSFNGALELMKIISETSDAHDCYSRGLFGYIFARDIVADSAADKALLAAITRRSQESASIKSMVLDLVSTDSFLYRLP
ncbi:MAG TPA: DUF1592 domain-containing protein [Polyangia bacterium]